MNMQVSSIKDADALVEEWQRALRRTAAGLVGPFPLGERVAHDSALEALAEAHRARAALWASVPVPMADGGQGGEFNQATRYALMRAAALAERYDLAEAARYEGLIGGLR